MDWNWQQWDRERRALDGITFDDGCWNWAGSLSRYGYGRIRGKPERLAHRVVYELLVGPIPEGLQLDHLCRNPRCVRPDHLEPVTHRENLLRGETFAARHAGKTHCPAGHPYDDANTYISKRGQRKCRKCAAERSLRNYYARRHAPAPF